MAVAAYIDETGIHIPEYQDMVDDLKAKWRAIFGEDLYLETDSQEGEMLEIFALAIYDAYLFAAAAYHSFSPQTAQEAGLSRVVKINGIRRRPATHSYADVRIVGAAGTMITQGIVEDTAQQKWNLPAVVQIPYEGEILTTAIAQEPGVIRSQPGDINKIATPTRGWQTVENPDAAIAGRSVESDAELRYRQTYSTSLPSLTVLEGITGAVAALGNVQTLRSYENFTGLTDVNGLPPHSISLVVHGGEIQEIAETIHSKKTPGTGTYGDITIPVTDKYGLETNISFFRPAMIRIAASVTIQPLAGYTGEISEQIKANLTAYINALGIGNSVLLSKLYTPVNAAGSGMCFDILQILLSRGYGNFEAQNVSIAFNEMASSDAEGINVVVM